MSLEQGLRNGWLLRDDPAVAEIQQLLQLCMVALRASGYRVRKGQGHHKHGIDSLRHTLGPQWEEIADHIERCSRLRSHAMYERINVVSADDARDLVESARKLRSDVIEWLKSHHPELVPPGY